MWKRKESTSAHTLPGVECHWTHHFSIMPPDLITEGVLLHIGKHNYQRMKRLSGNTIEDVKNPNLGCKFPNFTRAIFKTLLSPYSMEHIRNVY